MVGQGKQYWFPRKTHGWGWGLPVAWQGWLVLAAYAIGVVVLHFLFLLPAVRIGAFLAGMAVLTVLLVAVCWLKGEPPDGWHWGD